MNGLQCIYGNKHLQVVPKHSIIGYGFNPVLAIVRCGLVNIDPRHPKFIQPLEASLITYGLRKKEKEKSTSGTITAHRKQKNDLTKAAIKLQVKGQISSHLPWWLSRFNMQRGRGCRSTLHLCLQEKTWTDNLWRQHIIYVPAAVHSIDGEKRWSPVCINAAALSRDGTGTGTGAGPRVAQKDRRIWKYGQNFFFFPHPFFLRVCKYLPGVKVELSMRHDWKQIVH